MIDFVPQVFPQYSKIVLQNEKGILYNVKMMINFKAEIGGFNSWIKKPIT